MTTVGSFLVPAGIYIRQSAEVSQPGIKIMVSLYFSYCYLIYKVKILSLKSSLNYFVVNLLIFYTPLPDRFFDGFNKLLE